VPGEIHMQRRYRHAILANRMKICPRPGIRLGAWRANPVNRVAMRIGRLDHRLGFVTMPEARGLKAASCS